MKRGERVKRQLKDFKKYNEANSITLAKDFGKCFICNQVYIKDTRVYLDSKLGAAHTDCYEYNFKERDEAPRNTPGKRQCIDCARDVWGKFLVYLDGDKTKPLHSRCLENRKKTERLYKFRGL